MPISEDEYKNHKEKCGQSFEEIFKKLDKLDLAMFGDQKVEVKGVLEMTKEMYDSIKMAKGGQQVFWVTVKIAGGISVIIGAFWATYEFLKRIIIN